MIMDTAQYQNSHWGNRPAPGAPPSFDNAAQSFFDDSLEVTSRTMPNHVTGKTSQAEMFDERPASKPSRQALKLPKVALSLPTIDKELFAAESKLAYNFAIACLIFAVVRLLESQGQFATAYGYVAWVVNPWAIALIFSAWLLFAMRAASSALTKYNRDQISSEKVNASIQGVGIVAAWLIGYVITFALLG
jgi:hypothetical protein